MLIIASSTDVLLISSHPVTLELEACGTGTNPRYISQPKPSEKVLRKTIKCLNTYSSVYLGFILYRRANGEGKHNVNRNAKRSCAALD